MRYFVRSIMIFEKCGYARWTYNEKSRPISRLTSKKTGAADCKNAIRGTFIVFKKVSLLSNNVYGDINAI